MAALNTSELKRFAQAGRVQLLEQVSGKLAYVLSPDSLARRENEAAITELEKEIAESSQDQVIDQVAYTWFNRFCALRFMDVNRYTRLGTVSPAEGFVQPEILGDAKQGVIDDSWGVDKRHVLDLLDGTLPSEAPEQEAYRLLLVAVCNSFHSKMPFLFEKITDYTELLMPDDLLSESSFLAALRNALTPEACETVETIGWLYQFYISEKKDDVIGKVVKSEDIPAATQLFTPNWIVKYMVQNSLGAQWLATYPDSAIKDQLEYYIEPAKQTEEVQKQLAEITPDSLNPEEITLVDPACGSGHILVEAYDLFKAIYLERGYVQRDIAQLILTKNLYGLEICGRAAQLTGFALMMKARADDRRFFEWGINLNVVAIQESTEFDVEGLAEGVKIADYGITTSDLTELKDLFEHATTFGALIQVPQGLADKIPALKKLSEATSQDLFVSEAIKRLGPLVAQAELLAAQYDNVVANPPYMGSKYHTPILKKFLKDNYKGYEKDVFSAFIDRDLALSKPQGRLGFMSPFVWMFISSHEHLRTRLVEKETIASLIQLESSSFKGATVSICTFTLQKDYLKGQRGSYICLSSFRGSDKQGPKTLEAIRNRECGWLFEAAQDEFKQIPRSPVAYSLSTSMRAVFKTQKSLAEVGSPKEGLNTTDNDRFLRRWWECGLETINFDAHSADDVISSGVKWFPCQKGGANRKWFGNNEHLVNWHNNGQEIKSTVIDRYGSASKRVVNEHLYFREGLTWSDIASSRTFFRCFEEGFIFNNKANCIFFDEEYDKKAVLSFVNSFVFESLLRAVNPTLTGSVGTLAVLPAPPKAAYGNQISVDSCVSISKFDWNSYERSWDFQSLPLLSASSEPTPTLESSYTAWTRENRGTIAEMKRLEEENNRLFIDAYGLQDEMTPEVPIEQITLTVNPAYRYGIKKTADEIDALFQADTMREYISYAVGCMLGRYSLDEPGLAYANSGNEGFDPTKYTSFPADDDNVIPILDGEWFTDEISERFKEFLKVTFGTEQYEENLTFLEDSLYPGNLAGKKRKTIRHYFLKDFYNHHGKLYKKRPIYWLFSSPKGTFNALIYLHRYKSDTPSVVLGYLRDLQTKLGSEINRLESLTGSTATSEGDKVKALKQVASLRSQMTELEEYEHDVLYPLATQQISLDLDDGVKVNYNLLGTALKKITGLTAK
jgi:type II restriction/modification system DNA methylase subunit YeeA